MLERILSSLSAINLPVFAMPSFGINSILDILFISFCLYRLLIWIKETRAWTLFKGIIVVVLIYVLAFVFNMDTTRQIIESSLNAAVLAALVIFQPELRKALERLGNNRNIPFITALDEGKEELSSKSVEEIAKAAMRLSTAKLGALIVIEQKVPLGDLEATGVPIDAVVTSQLLINIFEKNTPLHDGAVLIRENKIKAATCILPLTQSDLDDLGTRHRAAVGVSEVSDCYVVVVSEETGAVSIAREGKLKLQLRENDILDIFDSSRPKKVKKRKKRGRKAGDDA